MRSIIILLLAFGLAACATTEPSSSSQSQPGTPPTPESAPAAKAEPQPEILPAAEPEPEPAPDPALEPEPMAAAEPAPALSGESTQTEAVAEPAKSDSATVAEAAEPATATASLTGQLTVFQNGREQPFASMHLSQTVIAWQPANGKTVASMPSQQVVTRQSRFFPQVMTVTSGTEVKFPNMDSIQHNVFSLTPGHRFDLGLYGQGEGESHRFIGSGMVELFCNLHPNMAAFMLVLETPYFTTPDQDGVFTLSDLPLGPGELVVWNYRATDLFERQEMNLSTYNEPLSLNVDITRPSVPQHTNKHGDAYSRGRSR